MKTPHVSKKLFNANIQKGRKLLRQSASRHQTTTPVQQSQYKKLYNAENTGYILDHIKNVINRFRKK